MSPPLTVAKKNYFFILDAMSLTDGSDNERSRNHFVTDTQTHFSYHTSMEKRRRYIERKEREIDGET